MVGSFLQHVLNAVASFCCLWWAASCSTYLTRLRPSVACGGQLPAARTERGCVILLLVVGSFLQHVLNAVASFCCLWWAASCSTYLTRLRPSVACGAGIRVFPLHASDEVPAFRKNIAFDYVWKNGVFGKMMEAVN